MKTNIKSLVCAILFSAPVLAQDVIIFKNGEELKVKVKEVSPTAVIYNKYDNLNGPVYSESRSAIFMVKYENGSKDVFSDSAPEPVEIMPETTAQPVIDNPGSNDLIVLTSGEYIYCTIDRTTKTHIFYHIPKRGPDVVGFEELSGVVSYTKKGVVTTIGAARSKNPIVPQNNNSSEDPILEERKYGGPRVGLTVAGDGALSSALEAEGKRNYFTQFGWQFEKRVFTLKNGLSGMFEFVPMIGGLDMGKFIPSASAFIGLRTKEGFEFGAGPNLAIFHGKNLEGRNSTSANFGIIIAAGFSLKAGNVYFPVNLAFVPSVTKQQSVYNPATRQTTQVQYETGMKFTLSVGFNSRKG